MLATLLGTLVGLARLSPNWLLARLAAAYVEVVRNVPLLVQLFFWYALISENLPGAARGAAAAAGRVPSATAASSSRALAARRC